MSPLASRKLQMLKHAILCFQGKEVSKLARVSQEKEKKCVEVITPEAEVVHTF